MLLVMLVYPNIYKRVSVGIGMFFQSLRYDRIRNMKEFIVWICIMLHNNAVIFIYEKQRKVLKGRKVIENQNIVLFV